MKFFDRLGPSACTAYGGGFAALVFAACCAGLFAFVGITSLAITIGAWRLDLLSGAVLVPLLAASLVASLVGHGMMRRARRVDPPR